MAEHWWNPDWDALATERPIYRVRWESDPPLWAPILDLRAAEMRGRPATVQSEAPAPVDPEWVALARRGESCEFRQAVAEAGCCGPRMKCVGGRHDGQIVEPISVCVACMRALDASLPAG
jgi:hypothetical protein